MVNGMMGRFALVWALSVMLAGGMLGCANEDAVSEGFGGLREGDDDAAVGDGDASDVEACANPDGDSPCEEEAGAPGADDGDGDGEDEDDGEREGEEDDAEEGDDEEDDAEEANCLDEVTAWCKREFAHECAEAELPERCDEELTAFCEREFSHECEGEGEGEEGEGDDGEEDGAEEDDAEEEGAEEDDAEEEGAEEDDAEEEGAEEDDAEEGGDFETCLKGVIEWCMDEYAHECEGAERPEACAEELAGFCEREFAGECED